MVLTDFVARPATSAPDQVSGRKVGWATSMRDLPSTVTTPATPSSVARSTVRFRVKSEKWRASIAPIAPRARPGRASMVTVPAGQSMAASRASECAASSRTGSSTRASPASLSDVTARTRRRTWRVRITGSPSPVTVSHAVRWGGSPMARSTFVEARPGLAPRSNAACRSPPATVATAMTRSRAETRAARPSDSTSRAPGSSAIRSPTVRLRPAIARDRVATTDPARASTSPSIGSRARPASIRLSRTESVRPASTPACVARPFQYPSRSTSVDPSACQSANDSEICDPVRPVRSALATPSFRPATREPMEKAARG